MGAPASQIPIIAGTLERAGQIALKIPKVARLMKGAEVVALESKLASFASSPAGKAALDAIERVSKAESAVQKARSELEAARKTGKGIDAARATVTVAELEYTEAKAAVEAVIAVGSDAAEAVQTWNQIKEARYIRHAELAANRFTGTLRKPIYVLGKTAKSKDKLTSIVVEQAEKFKLARSLENADSVLRAENDLALVNHAEQSYKRANILIKWFSPTQKQYKENLISLIDNFANKAEALNTLKKSGASTEAIAGAQTALEAARGALSAGTKNVLEASVLAARIGESEASLDSSAEKDVAVQIGTKAPSRVAVDLEEGVERAVPQTIDETVKDSGRIRRIIKDSKPEDVETTVKNAQNWRRDLVQDLKTDSLTAEENYQAGSVGSVDNFVSVSQKGGGESSIIQVEGVKLRTANDLAGGHEAGNAYVQTFTKEVTKYFRDLGYEVDAYRGPNGVVIIQGNIPKDVAEKASKELPNVISNALNKDFGPTVGNLFEQGIDGGIRVGFTKVRIPTGLDRTSAKELYYRGLREAQASAESLRSAALPGTSATGFSSFEDAVSAFKKSPEEFLRQYGKFVPPEAKEGSLFVVDEQIVKTGKAIDEYERTAKALGSGSTPERQAAFQQAKTNLEKELSTLSEMSRRPPRFEYNEGLIDIREMEREASAAFADGDFVMVASGDLDYLGSFFRQYKVEGADDIYASFYDAMTDAVNKYNKENGLNIKISIAKQASGDEYTIILRFPSSSTDAELHTNNIMEMIRQAVEDAGNKFPIFGGKLDKDIGIIRGEGGVTTTLGTGFRRVTSIDELNLALEENEQILNARKWIWSKNSAGADLTAEEAEGSVLLFKEFEKSNDPAAWKKALTALNENKGELKGALSSSTKFGAEDIDELIVAFEEKLGIRKVKQANIYTNENGGRSVKVFLDENGNLQYLTADDPRFSALGKSDDGKYITLRHYTRRKNFDGIIAEGSLRPGKASNPVMRVLLNLFTETHAGLPKVYLTDINLGRGPIELVKKLHLGLDPAQTKNYIEITLPVSLVQERAGGTVGGPLGLGKIYTYEGKGAINLAPFADVPKTVPPPVIEVNPRKLALSFRSTQELSPELEIKFDTFEEDIKNNLRRIGVTESKLDQTTADILGQLPKKDGRVLEDGAIAVYNNPLEISGGDWFKVSKTDGKLRVLKVDEVGHGDDAAKRLSIFQAVEEDLANSEFANAPLNEYLNEFNKRLVGANSKFVSTKRSNPTFSILEIDENGLMTFAVSEEPMFVYSEGEVTERGGYLDFNPRLGLGTEVKSTGKKITYTTTEKQLQEGDVVVLLSDGIIDGINPEKVSQARKAIADIIGESSCQSPEEIRDAIVSALGKQVDDESVVVIKLQSSLKPQTVSVSPEEFFPGIMGLAHG